MLEELLATGHGGAEYDAWLINIGEGDQFSSGYVAGSVLVSLAAVGAGFWLGRAL